MQITIPAETLERHRALNKDFMMISARGNAVRLVTTNERIMVVELIAHSEEIFDIGFSPIGDDELTLNIFAPLKMVTPSSIPLNLFRETPAKYTHWTTVTERANKCDATQHGFMYLDLELAKLLCAIAPSTGVTFPLKIDTRCPIFVNDVRDENWIAFFHPRDETYSKGLKAATMKGFAL